MGNAPITLFLGTSSGLTDEGRIQANGQEILVGQNSWPWVDDWNGDGKKDLIVGQEAEDLNAFSGGMRIYLNSGTNAEPVFGDYSLITANGQKITHTRSTPIMLDLDNDGKKDLITGAFDGNVYFYKNTGTGSEPGFGSSEKLKLSSGAAIDDGCPPRVHFVDWEGDGDFDMLLCDYDGNVDLYENDSPVNSIHGSKQLTNNTPFVTSYSPFSSKVVCTISLSKNTFVKADIYSSNGRLIDSPIECYKQKGRCQFTWNVNADQGRKVLNGVYVIRIKTNTGTDNHKFVLTH